MSKYLCPFCEQALWIRTLDGGIVWNGPCKDTVLRTIDGETFWQERCKALSQAMEDNEYYILDGFITFIDGPPYQQVALTDNWPAVYAVAHEWVEENGWDDFPLCDHGETE